MSSQNGDAAAREARGDPEFDLLGSGVDRENNSASAQAEATPIVVTIRGRAVAKGRPWFTHSGTAHAPAKIRKYQAHGRLAAQLAMGDRLPVSGPVRLTALVELPVPGSWSKRRRASAIVGDIRPASRPDVDNFLNSAMYAIKRIVVADDSLVVEVTVKKQFGVDPKLILLIVPIDADASNREAPL